MTDGFDKLARPYRALEYLTFGRALERCRFHFLPHLNDTQHALLLGDGDGRFTAALLRSAPQAHATAMDGSAAMLQALSARCTRDGNASRLTTLQADLRVGLPSTATRYDAIAAHFCLDCLSETEVDCIAHDASQCASDNAMWVVSEFRVPEVGVMRPVASVIVKALYATFRMLTGLRVTHLPNHHVVLQRHGWRLREHHLHLQGLLVSELWRRTPSDAM